MKQSLIKKLRVQRNRQNKLYTLKDIKLPFFILNDPRYEIPSQAQNEPDQHYYFKTYLGYNLRQYINYNTNGNLVGYDTINKHPFFRHLNSSMITFEYPHFYVKVTKKNELAREIRTLANRQGLYYYHSDIVFKFDWMNKKYHIFIEINGGIHTKNAEQKQNNRMRYYAIRDYYQNHRSDRKMIMIIFEADEYQYHKMDYFINITINTFLEGKEKYPDPFLFEL